MAQAPTAITSFGAGTAAYAAKSAVRIFSLTGPVTNQTLTNNTSQLAIGHNPASSNDGLDADLDEVAIYNIGLTPIQVQQHYAAGTDAVCTPIAPLVAPGPRVTMQIPGRPVSFPYASAMFAAPASCRHVINRIGES